MFWLFNQFVGLAIAGIAILSILYFVTWMFKIAVSGSSKPEKSYRVRF
jgi:hypothetical protein